MKNKIYTLYQRSSRRYFNSRFASTPVIHTGLRALARITVNPANRLLTGWLAFRKGLKFPAGSKHQLAMLLDDYEPDVVSLCRQYIQPGMVVIDAGAYAGYYTLLFSELVGPTGKVYAFEPHPENFDTLKHNSQQSRFKQNIVLLQNAVSDRVGTVQISAHKTDTAKTSLYSAEKNNISLTIETTTIDSFFVKYNLAKIDLIKLDIEGAELAALDGMQNLIASNNKLMVIVECSPQILARSGSAPTTLINKINNLGFTVSAIGPRGELINPETALAQARNDDINLFCKKKQNG